MDMGFAEPDARRALQDTNFNVEQAIERLLADTGDFHDVEPDSADPFHPATGLDGTGTGGQGDEQPMLMNDPTSQPKMLELTPWPEQDVNMPLLRSDIAGGTAEHGSAQDLLSPSGAPKERGLPCGLLNVGNTCYVNSLLQTLLHIEGFRRHMLRYRTPAELPPPPPPPAPADGEGEAPAEAAGAASGEGGPASSGEAPEAPAPTTAEPDAEDSATRREADRESRRDHGVRLASAMRHLFASSMFTLRSCIDPSRLLDELVDQRGQKLHIGSQEDVGEFMLKLLEQLDEGLRAGVFVDPSAPAFAAEAEGAAPTAEAEAAPQEGGAPAQGGAPAAAESAEQAGAAAEAGEEAAEQRRLSLLQTLFFGEQVQCLSYEDAVAAPQSPDDAADPAKPDASKTVVSEETSEFLHIFLDVKFKDLYSAWEAACRTEVDYTTPSGSTTKASTCTWIKRLPKVLFFQLQRVAFNQETKAQVKLDDAFEFERTIYVDRFLLQNKEAASSSSALVRDLRLRRDDLSAALCSFEAFDGRPGLGVDQVLAWATSLVEENARAVGVELPAPPDGDGKAEAREVRGDLPSPHTVAKAADDKTSGDDAAGPPACREEDLRSSAAGAASLLRGLRASCERRVQSLRADIGRLELEMESAYTGLRAQAYELHAIWLHSGIAGSGHYLAYVRDRRRQRWYRLNDVQVAVVSWDDVRMAAVNREGSSTSAYVLVYIEAQEEAATASAPSAPRTAVEGGEADAPTAGGDAAPAQDALVAEEEAEVLREASRTAPREVLEEILRDNVAFRSEQRMREVLLADRELKCHAEAIFQHYAGLVHTEWEPLKRVGDSAGSAYDTTGRKFLQDGALQCFELFLYRLHGEKEVWTLLVERSVEAQRKVRQWSAEDEGRVLWHLSNVLRGHNCRTAMLKEKTCALPTSADQPAANAKPQCELHPLDMAKLSAQYNVILVQAHAVDQALQALKDDRGNLLKVIGMLAHIWGRWNLELEDKFRQNEVLLMMSALIFNVVGALEKGRRITPEVPIATFEPACAYFLLLIHAVEWPKHWKQPIIGRIQLLFPQAANQLPARARSAVSDGAGSPMGAQVELKEEMKEAVMNHPCTLSLVNWESLELERPEPGPEFFDRHRTLYSWCMSTDEAIAQEYVMLQAPALGVVDDPPKDVTVL